MRRERERRRGKAREGGERGQVELGGRGRVGALLPNKMRITSGGWETKGQQHRQVNAQGEGHHRCQPHSKSPAAVTPTHIPYRCQPHSPTHRCHPHPPTHLERGHAAVHHDLFLRRHLDEDVLFEATEQEGPQDLVQLGHHLLLLLGAWGGWVGGWGGWRGR